MSNIIKKEDLRFIPKTSDNPYIKRPKVKKSNGIIAQSVVLAADQSHQPNTQLAKQEKTKNEARENTIEKAITEPEQPIKGLRIGRIKYINHSLFFGIGGGVSLAIFPPVAIILIPALLISTKRRLNDLNQSGIRSLLILIPLVNFAFGLYLYFAAGDEGINDYGEPPTLSALDIILFIFSLLSPFIIAFIVFVIIMSEARFY